MEYVYFLINQRQKNDVGRASFEDLPDEIILKIFSYVNIKDLFRCMAVNKKMRAIASDKSLWKRIHLAGEFPVELLEEVLDRGCQYLSLYRCKVLGDNVWFKKNFQ